MNKKRYIAKLKQDEIGYCGSFYYYTNEKGHKGFNFDEKFKFFPNEIIINKNFKDYFDLYNDKNKITQ